MTGNGLAIERLKPSDLSGGDIELWHELMLSHPAFCNAFLSPEFAIACEHVYRSVEVAVIHRGGTVCGFFPYQFVSSQKKILRLAERIGENMSDCAGIVADPQAGLNASDIFSLSGLNLIFLTHVYSSDPLLGPLASNLEDLHVIDLTTGKNAYLETLRKRKSFYQDTQRCRRKLSSEIGAVKFGYDSTPPLDAVQHVLDRKQAQYRASGAVAVFDRFERRALIAALNEVHSPYCAISVATLKAGDRDCAWHFGLICQGVMHYWFPVYEKSLGKYSPGRMLVLDLVEAAADLGIMTIDLGAGDAPWKRNLANVTQKIGKVFWRRPSVLSLPAQVLVGLEWRLGQSRE